MSTEKTTAKKKEAFKLPHLFFIILGLLMLMSILTYILPAGQFAVDENGAILGDQFSFLEENTPVSPLTAIQYIYDGLVKSAAMVALLLCLGGTVNVMLNTKSMDRVIDWLLYKLQDKGVNVILPIIFMIMVYFGAFAGGDPMVALIPLGIMIAKKLRLDPMIAMATVGLAPMLGFATSPIQQMMSQLLMGVPVYSGFGTRLAITTVFGVIGMLYTFRYAKKVAKNPANSALPLDSWVPALGENAGGFAKVELSMKDVLITGLFFGQYVFSSVMMISFGYPMSICVVTQIVVAIFCGFLSGMDNHKLGNNFAQGVAGMAFVSLIIGMASALSLVMSNGNILHTIVYYISLPLRSLSSGLAAIGVSISVAVINLFVPSASAKAAVLIPIVSPLAQTLNIHPQIAVQAFQIGDGFTNMVTPAGSWLMGCISVAGIPFNKWLKWVIPLIIALMILSYVILYILAAIGWTGM